MKTKDVNQIIQWLKDGKKIRPVDRKLRIVTTIPMIHVAYTDGSYSFSKLTGEEKDEYFNKQFVEVNVEEDKQVDKVSLSGFGSDKTYEVLYVYFNPQCNRTLCKLENGHITDYDFSLTDFIYHEFEVVENINQLPPLEMTRKELELHFGRPVSIIE